jgi:Domain of unknown function (DUF1707)
MPDPNLRAADSDRQAVAAALGRHFSDGRLTVEEYDERLAKAYAARTYGELEGLFADLPRATSARPADRPAPEHTPAPVRAGGCAARGGPVRGAWASWAMVAVIVTAIWLFSSVAGGFHYFWPIWVVGPWGALLLSRTLGGGQHRGQARRRG